MSLGRASAYRQIELPGGKRGKKEGSKEVSPHERVDKVKKSGYRTSAVVQQGVGSVVRRGLL